MIIAVVLVLMAWIKHHSLTLGTTQCGKTYSHVHWLLGLVGKVALAIIDPQSSLSTLFLKHAVCRGLLKRVPVVVDQLWRDDRTVGYNLLKRSTASNERTREREDKRYQMEFAQFLTRMRGIKLLESVLIREGLFLSIRLLQQAREKLAEYMLIHALKESPEQEYMLDICEKKTIAQEVRAFSHVPLGLWRREVAPAHRLIEELCENETFRDRTGGSTVDFQELWDAKGIYIIEGGGVDRETAGMLCGIGVAEGMRYKENGGKSEMVIDMDEIVSFPGLLTERELVGFQAMLKEGLSLHVTSQHLEGLAPEFVEALWECCNHKEFFNMSAPKTRGLVAEDLMHRTYDPKKVKYEEVRKREMGRGYSNWGDSERPIYLKDFVIGEEKTRHLYTSQEQQVVKSGQLAELDTRWKYVIENNRVELRETPFLEEPYPWPGLAEMKTFEFVEELVKCPPYRTPSRFVLPERKRRGAAKRRGRRGEK